MVPALFRRGLERSDVENVHVSRFTLSKPQSAFSRVVGIRDQWKGVVNGISAGAWS